MGDNKGQLRLRELFPNRGNRRHRQDQVADPFELNEEEVQPALRNFLHRHFVGIEEAKAEMIPGEVVDHALPSRAAHLLHKPGRS